MSGSVSDKIGGKRTVIVTGANCGLGFECAKQLFHDEKHDWHVVLACRDETRGKEALQNIIGSQSVSNNRISLILLNLSDLESVRNFVKEFESAKLPPLKALVANAGIVAPGKLTLTKQGYEITFGVNHLGHFLLTNLLLPLFERGSNEINSIAVVSSEVHNPNIGIPMPKAKYDSIEKLVNPTYETPQDIGSRYPTSKLCNILFTYELLKRLQNSSDFKDQFRVTCFNPGFVPETRLSRNADPEKFKVMVEQAKDFKRELSVSGGDLARLVNPDETSVISGSYYDGKEKKASSDESYHVEKQVELWESSKNLIMKNSEFFM